MSVNRRLTLEDLRELCDRYVPLASRHPNSLFDADEPPDGWWWAHEIGHLLTVDPRGIGEPLFGLDTLPVLEEQRAHEMRCRELAAMSVSGRLLVAIGRADLVRAERSETDPRTLAHPDRGRTRGILRRHRCLRVPRARAALERKLQRATGGAA